MTGYLKVDCFNFLIYSGQHEKNISEENMPWSFMFFLPILVGLYVNRSCNYIALEHLLPPLSAHWPNLQQSTYLQISKKNSSRDLLRYPSSIIYFFFFYFLCFFFNAHFCRLIQAIWLVDCFDEHWVFYSRLKGWKF